MLPTADSLFVVPGGTVAARGARPAFPIPLASFSPRTFSLSVGTSARPRCRGVRRVGVTPICSIVAVLIRPPAVDAP